MVSLLRIGKMGGLGGLGFSNRYGIPRADSTAYVEGDIRSFAGQVHLCVFAGTSDVAEPTIIAPIGASDVIVNGNFDTDTGWGKAANWTIATGVAHSDGTQVTNATMSQTAGLAVGKAYLTSYTISSLIAGNVRMNVGGIAPTSWVGIDGDHSAVIVASNSPIFYVQADVSFIGDVDDVSSIEVTKDGTAAWRTIG